MEAPLFKLGRFTRLGKILRCPLVRGCVDSDPIWDEGENILLLPGIEARFLDSLAVHDLYLQFLLTGGYNKECIEVISMIRKSTDC